MELNDIIKPENLVYEKPRLMNENPMHYCRNAWDVRNAVPPCLLPAPVTSYRSLSNPVT